MKPSPWNAPEPTAVSSAIWFHCETVFPGGSTAAARFPGGGAAAAGAVVPVEAGTARAVMATTAICSARTLMRNLLQLGSSSTDATGSMFAGPLRPLCSALRRSRRGLEVNVLSEALEFRVLGPIELVHDGIATRIGSPTQRTLLALLLQHPGKVVSTDRIVDVLWPGNPPDAHRKLWFHVSKLRRILEPSGAEDATGKLLGTRPTGYFLRIELDQLDATRFEHLAGAARRLLRDEPARASEMLRTALALWQGEPFQDVLHEDALSPEAARLNELRLAAVSDRL